MLTKSYIETSLKKKISILDKQINKLTDLPAAVWIKIYNKHHNEDLSRYHKSPEFGGGLTIHRIPFHDNSLPAFEIKAKGKKLESEKEKIITKFKTQYPNTIAAEVVSYDGFDLYFIKSVMKISLDSFKEIYLSGKKNKRSFLKMGFAKLEKGIQLKELCDQYQIMHPLEANKLDIKAKMRKEIS